MSSIFTTGAVQAAPSSLNFRQVLEVSRDYIWVLNLDGDVVYGNGAARSLNAPGVPADGPWRDLWPDSERFTVDRAVQSAASGTMAAFRAQLSRENGDRIYMQARVTPVADANGRIAHLLASGRDATREVEQTAFLNSIVELLPLALLVKDVPSDRYVLANRAAHDLLDTDEPIMGRGTAEVFQPDHVALTLEHDAAAIISGGAQTAEIEIEHKGRARWIAARRVTTFDDAGPRHLITLAEDVTGQRRDAEALRRALAAAETAGRARTAFLANMSHEIRTPLNGVIAGAEMLAGRELGDAERELVEMVRTSSTVLRQRLDEILEMVRLDTGEIRLEAHPFKPDELLGLFQDSHGPRASAKGLDLHIHLSPETPPLLMGDRRRIRQALSHLVDNAIKFSEAGLVTLSVAPGPEGFVRFCVQDQGVGFALIDKPRLFARFHQQDDSLTRRHGGLGLGLAAARDLVELMGGLIDAEPCEEGGARFWIDLPLDQPEVAHSEQGEPRCDDRPGDEPLRVLAVDDHPANRRILELLMADMACLTVAENGRDAVQAWSDGPFDLVLMDIQMPVMDGLEATREIRRLEAENGRPRTPIMMLSANCEPEHIRAGRAAGADRHMAKPFTGPALLQAVRDMLKP